MGHYCFIKPKLYYDSLCSVISIVGICVVIRQAQYGFLELNIFLLCVTLCVYILLFLYLLISHIFVLIEQNDNIDYIQLVNYT